MLARVADGQAADGERVDVGASGFGLGEAGGGQGGDQAGVGLADVEGELATLLGDVSVLDSTWPRSLASQGSRLATC